MHLTISFALAVGLLASCSPYGAKQRSELSSTPIIATTTNRITPPLPSDDQPRHYPGLHNVVAYHDGCYSGGVPIGENGFDTLKALGVRTIISVDGAVARMRVYAPPDRLAATREGRGDRGATPCDAKYVPANLRENPRPLGGFFRILAVRRHPSHPPTACKSLINGLSRAPLIRPPRGIPRA